MGKRTGHTLAAFSDYHRFNRYFQATWKKVRSRLNLEMVRLADTQNHSEKLRALLHQLSCAKGRREKARKKILHLLRGDEKPPTKAIQAKPEKPSAVSSPLEEKHPEPPLDLKGKGGKKGKLAKLESPVADVYDMLLLLEVSIRETTAYASLVRQTLKSLCKLVEDKAFKGRVAGLVYNEVFDRSKDYNSLLTAFEGPRNSLLEAFSNDTRILLNYDYQVVIGYKDVIPPPEAVVWENKVLERSGSLRRSFWADVKKGSPIEVVKRGTRSFISKRCAADDPWYNLENNSPDFHKGCISSYGDELKALVPVGIPCNLIAEYVLTAEVKPLRPGMYTGFMIAESNDYRFVPALPMAFGRQYHEGDVLSGLSRGNRTCIRFDGTRLSRCPNPLLGCFASMEQEEDLSELLSEVFIIVWDPERDNLRLVHRYGEAVVDQASLERFTRLASTTTPYLRSLAPHLG